MRPLLLFTLLSLTPSAWGCSDSWSGIDQPSIIGIPTGSTIGAVPYLSRGRDDGEDMIRE